MLLFAPVAYGVIRLVGDFQVFPMLLLLTACTLYALYLIKRKQPDDAQQATTIMIAGIALADALLISTSSSLLIAAIAVAAFLLILFLQRYIADT